MKSYTTLASYYDRSMIYVDYRGWYNHIIKILKHFRHKTKTIIDLGGGTGSLAYHFSKHGFKIDILDKSKEMLAEASKKKYKSTVDFFHNDLKSFSLNKNYDLAICLNNTINYIQTTTDLKSMFKSIHNILNKNALLIIDNCSEHFYQTHYDGKMFSEHFDDFSYDWDHNYDQNNKKATMTFTINNHKENISFSEKHINILYNDKEIINAAKGLFNCLAIFDGFSLKERSPKTNEIYYVLRKIS